ncbi:MAG TPA: sodium:solute symporter [Aquaticitalea sp.]|nr:sodium:solute symporter [Aquaticitalea sp.]
MSPTTILLLIAAYFGLLILISFFTGKNSDNDTFFKANKQSPWYVVAFGMIGASLSGVTFISVPGWVEASKFGYYQVVLGYILGYAVVGLILLPLYYRLNLTTIYPYLEERYGTFSYKTGALFFILSRTIGASFRLYLVAIVLQSLVFDSLNIPFWATVSITIALIWLYTFRSGIKTIVWTDTLQTLFMLVSVGYSIYYISDGLGISGSNLISYVSQSELSQIFFFDDFKSANYFWKQFLSGAFITIVMTGLDQDMMQKNLTCKTLKDAQKNMFWFTGILVLANLMFLVLGLLLTHYAHQNGIDASKDLLFPTIATQSDLGFGLATVFILGLIAAAYSSADGALTALTTSFCIDIMDIEKRFESKKQVRARRLVHVGFSLLFVAIMVGFKYLVDDASVIERLFVFAGYTYGPLLGLYAFGLFTNINVKDKLVPIIAIISPLLSYIVSINSLKWFGFEFGFFILILNGFLTFIGLFLISQKKVQASILGQN